MLVEWRHQLVGGSKLLLFFKMWSILAWPKDLTDSRQDGFFSITSLTSVFLINLGLETIKRILAFMGHMSILLPMS